MEPSIKDAAIHGDVTPPSPKIRHILAALAEMATSVGADFIAREALDLSEGLAAEPCFVACIGQPQRGVPTLMNALVGTPILPKGVVLVRTIVTLFNYRPSPE